MNSDTIRMARLVNDARKTLRSLDLIYEKIMLLEYRLDEVERTFKRKDNIM